MNDEDREAFVDFASTRWRTLVRSAVLLGCDHHEAEDLAQDTLLRCYQKWQTVSRADDPDRYAVRMLFNLQRRIRRRRWRGEVSAGTAEEITRTAASDPTIELVPDAAIAGKALSALTRHQREVVILRIYLDLSEREAAATLGVPTGTVKSRLSRALATLAADPFLAELNRRGV